MDSKIRFKQLSDEIEELQNWIVDHPQADYYAKLTVLEKWTNKCAERQTLVQSELTQLRNEFKN
jgi:hypothetical protein